METNKLVLIIRVYCGGWGCSTLKTPVAVTTLEKARERYHDKQKGDETTTYFYQDILEDGTLNEFSKKLF